jgi:hypothetical protein
LFKMKGWRIVLAKVCTTANQSPVSAVSGL